MINVRQKNDAIGNGKSSESLRDHGGIRATLALAAIMAMRMLGLFMILPVFMLEARQLNGATPLLMGFALGVYGLTQALLQMPFGLMSDRLGRKPIIATGLGIFILGSVVAATTHQIWGVIFGRALQGAGAVGSTIIALVADFTRISRRTQAMAILGMTIGIAFSLALILGPIVNNWWHLAGIFWICAGLGAFSLLILFTLVPAAPVLHFHQETEPIPALFGHILRQPELKFLNLSIFCLHVLLMLSFVAIPLTLEQTAHITLAHQWHLYFATLILSFFLMVPLLWLAERKQQLRPVFLSAIVGLGLSQVGFWRFSTAWLDSAVSLTVFFTSFNVLEACLPSLVSKAVTAARRGTAMGMYSTCQFLGIFCGGSLGGWILQHAGKDWVFWSATLLALIWGLIAFKNHNL